MMANYKKLIVWVALLQFHAACCQQTDSIRVYYIPVSFLSHLPITNPERVKTFPLSNHFTITDTAQIALFKQAMTSLERSDIPFKVFDIRVVCELYERKRSRQLQINGTKYIRYRKKYFKPSASLLSIIHPAGT